MWQHVCAAATFTLLYVSNSAHDDDDDDDDDDDTTTTTTTTTKKKKTMKGNAVKLLFVSDLIFIIANVKFQEVNVFRYIRQVTCQVN